MVLSGIVLVMILIIAYIWASRGLFSAFLHMLAVIVAGAIAFAVWEPVSYFILEKSSSRMVIDAAWGAGLAIPFFFSLLIIRIALDKLLPANVDLGALPNFLGGAICGVVSATISCGILVLSISSLRVSTEFMGYRPLTYDSTGSLSTEGGGGLFIPVHTVTAGLYGLFSDSTFRPIGSDDTLARWRPRLTEEGPALRTNYNEGASFHTLQPDAFTIAGRYTLGRAENLTLPELTKDTADSTSQKVNDTSGEPLTGALVLEGYIIDFGPKAREKSGRVILGPGQIRILVETDDGETKSFHPFAVVSLAEPPTAPSGVTNWKPPPPQFGRWRYNAADTFIGSVGGQNNSRFGFEFLLPKNAKPLALYVKGVRVELGSMASFRDFKTVAERDAEIKRGKLLDATAGSGGSASVGKLDKSKMVRYKLVRDGSDPFIKISSTIPYSVLLQKDNLMGLEINDAREIINGDARFTNDVLRSAIGIDRKLQVRKFAQNDDTSLVTIVVDKTNDQFGFMSRAAQGMDRDKAPLLIDSNNVAYTPIGYVYKDNIETRIRFVPSDPITAVADAAKIPSLSSSRPEQQMTLIYRITRGAKLQYFTVGEQALAEFQPTFDVFSAGN
jgi:hypothetical protein